MSREGHSAVAYFALLEIAAKAETIAQLAAKVAEENGPVLMEDSLQLITFALTASQAMLDRAIGPQFLD